jgi:DNA repair exonuclease SbcCD ATPase subunit
MKKTLFFSMLISLATICSCQKQGSAVEQQLAQRKVELDAREEALAERKSALDERVKALDERQKALDAREKAFAEKEKTAMNARTNSTDVQDPAQVQAERARIMQQLSTNLPDHSQLHAEKAQKDGEIQEQLSQRQEELQRARQRKMAIGMSGGAVFPAAQATSPPQSPAAEATSPSPSPTPQ